MAQSIQVSQDSLYSKLSTAIKRIEAFNRQEKKELCMFILQLESKVQSLEEVRVLSKMWTKGSSQQQQQLPSSLTKKVHAVNKWQSNAEVVN